MSLKYTMPEQLTLIGAASRIRVYRAVQLHYHRPPTTSYITDHVTPALQYLTDRAAKQWDIPQQYNAARWAVKEVYGHEDDNLAAALYNYCGNAPNFDNQKIQGTSIHRLIPDDKGITIQIGNPHTIQTRFNAGISAINFAINDCIRRNQSIADPAPFIKAAMITFYSYNNWFLSMPNKYHMKVFTAYGNYIDDILNAFITLKRPIPKYYNTDDLNSQEYRLFQQGTEEKRNAYYAANVPIPEITEPDNILPPQTVYLPYSAFIKTEISAAERRQRHDNNYKILYNACLEKAKRLPQGENFFTTKQLAAVGLQSKSLQSALDEKNGILSRIGRGIYSFDNAFWLDVGQ